MKKITLYLLGIIIAGVFTACRNDDPDSKSIFDDTVERNKFDNWLLENYTYPYNIDFKYRLEDIESDLVHNLAPAEIDKSEQLAIIVKHAWLGAYDEVAGQAFTKTYVPKIIHLIGSAAYDNTGTMILGTAEGGMKITFFLVNSLELDPEFLNFYYLHTMHHEFAHILHQTKNYNYQEFAQITPDKYISGSWYTIPEDSAKRMGFVTAYSQSSADEDFVEILSTYVTNTPEYWDNLLKTAGTSGAAKINRKFNIVKNYLKDDWSIDIDQLRSVVLRRTGEINKLDFDQIEKVDSENLQ
ncbi:MAG: putative zinc-binding metallopeptidase [Dysgonomonas sp.]